MRRLFVVLAVIVVLASMVWGFRILTSDVTLTPPNPDGLNCGGTYGSLMGEPSYGGELPYPDDWVDQCREAAQDRIGWIVVPAVTGPLALLYLTGAFVMVARRAKAEGRSTGAVR